MKIVEVIPQLYASGAIGEDWDQVGALGLDFIVGVGGITSSEPEMLKDPVYIDWHTNDVPKLPDQQRLSDIAKFVARQIKKHDARVLVHDKDGDNRVYLMVAAILWYLKYGDGMTIYDLIKSKQSTALSNITFRDFICGWDAK